MIALSETTREQVVQSINLFLASMIYRVLIVSYEVSEASCRRLLLYSCPRVSPNVVHMHRRLLCSEYRSSCGR